MASPPRDGTAPNLESSSKREAWHSNMAQKAQPELHIEADAADGHGEQNSPPPCHKLQAICTCRLLDWPHTCICLLPAARCYSTLAHDAGGGGAPRGSSWMGKLKVLCSEGHTAWDCELLVPHTSLAYQAHINYGLWLSRSLCISVAEGLFLFKGCVGLP
jgi:hypothetical protein